MKISEYEDQDLFLKTLKNFKPWHIPHIFVTEIIICTTISEGCKWNHHNNHREPHVFFQKHQVYCKWRVSLTLFADLFHRCSYWEILIWVTVSQRISKFVGKRNFNLGFSSIFWLRACVKRAFRPNNGWFFFQSYSKMSVKVNLLLSIIELSTTWSIKNMYCACTSKMVSYQWLKNQVMVTIT